MSEKKTTEVLLCVGAGGVGKTSVSAMLGLHHASLGKKVLVLTIDPARRLLDALSIPVNSNRPILVEHPSLQNSTGQLYAFMPNLKDEWMDFLSSSIKKDDAIHDISRNPFYTYMVDGLPGSLEIICSHLIYRILEANTYDTLVIDTPPSSNSLSFFDVPEKLIRVLEHQATRLFLEGGGSLFGRLSKKVALFSGNILVATLEKIIGSNFLSEVIDFAFRIDAIYEPMLMRAHKMSDLLKSEQTQFILVCRPTSTSVSDSINLQAALKKRGIDIREVVLNHLLFLPKKTVKEESKKLREEGFDSSVLEKVVHCFLEEYYYQQKLVQRLQNFFSASKLHFLHVASGEDLLATMLKDYHLGMHQ